MAAKRRAIETLMMEQLGVDKSPQYELLDVSEPPKRKAGVRVSSVAELVHKLHHEAKVLGALGVVPGSRLQNPCQNGVLRRLTGEGSIIRPTCCEFCPARHGVPSSGLACARAHDSGEGVPSSSMLCWDVAPSYMRRQTKFAFIECGISQ
eukprot:scaffold1480_cov22-Tisochrysis_lutea.AAC.1